MNPRILLQGDFAEEDIVIHYSDKGKRKINPQIESRIDNIWLETLISAKEKGQQAYDGISYRCDSLSINNGKLHLWISPTSFKIVNGLKKLKEEIWLLGEDYMSKCIAIASIIKTSDNKFIFGEKTGKTLSNSARDLIGGIIEDLEFSSSRVIFQTNIRELGEEASIKPEQIASSRLVEVIQSSTGSILIILYTKLNIDSNSLLERFRNENDNLELNNLIITDNVKLVEVLKSMEGYRRTIAESIENGKIAF